MTYLVTRRQVLRLGLVGGAVVAFPAGGLVGCGDDGESGGAATATPVPGTPTPTATPVPSFLTEEERRALQAMTARIVPTDDLPGAAEAGAARYIDRLLSVVPDESSPAGYVFAGGPFSGRNPFPDPSTGTPSAIFPADDFARFIPLTRLQLMSWRVQLLGSAAVPGADFNDAVLGPVVGLRDRYQAGLAGVQAKSAAMFGADFAALAAEEQDAVLKAADPQFLALVRGHTLEGMFGDPVYGGNSDRIGWDLIGYDGDSQPLGYSIFDTTTMSYRERPDKPSSTANPDEDFAGVSDATQRLLDVLVSVVGTPHFTPDQS